MPHRGLGPALTACLVASLAAAGCRATSERDSPGAGAAGAAAASAGAAGAAASGASGAAGGNGCDSGFGGEGCGTLLLGAAPLSAGLGDDSASYWDGSAMLDDGGVTHLFASRFVNGCGLDSWTTNSECVHATAASPLGPFAVDSVVVPAFCHNPSVRRGQGGEYLLFSIGSPADPASMATDCAGGRTITMPMSAGLSTANCDIRVMSSSSLTGPWSEATMLTDAGWLPLCPTNPSPVVHDDGSVDLFYRAYQLDAQSNTVERLFHASAAMSQGPYSAGDRKALFLRPGEDPFAWQRDDGKGWRILFNDKFTDPINVGGLADSSDGVTWQPAGAAYSLDVAMSDGTTMTVARRERPTILWLPGGRGVLYTGIVPSASDDRSRVLAVPIGAM